MGLWNAVSFFLFLTAQETIYLLCHFLPFMFQREQQWYEEQKHMLETLNKIEEEVNSQDEHPSTERYFYIFEMYFIFET